MILSSIWTGKQQRGADWKERLPLHTFLPSATEVLPLLLPVVVVIAMVAVVSYPIATVTGATAVVDGEVVEVAVPLFFVRFRTVSAASLRLQRGGPLAENVALLPGVPVLAGSPMSRVGLCVAPIQDVWLVAGGSGEVLPPRYDVGHGPQEEVCVRRSDQT